MRNASEDELLETIEDRDAAIGRLEEERDELAAAVSVLVTSICNARHRDQEQQEEIRKLERHQDQDDQDGQIADLKYELETCRSDLEEAQITISDLQDEIEALEKKKSSKKGKKSR